MDGQGFGIIAARRVKLSDAVCDQLVERIGTGGFAPGDALPSETELSRIFAVSKPVIREALGRLAAVGLVEIRQGRPTTVAALTSVPLTDFFALAVRMNPRGLREAVELRRALETQGVALAAERASEQDLVELRAIVEQMRDNAETLDAWVECDVRFHLTLARASGNSLVAFIMEALVATMREAILSLQLRRGNGDKSARLRMHAQILEAIERRDPAGASALMNAHFDATKLLVNTILDERDVAQR